MLVPSLLAAESHPSWWGFASPEANALVGIHWESLRQSPFADAVGAELSSSGSLGFPDLPCLREARQILISGPALLAMVSGAFPAAVVREQAAKKGLKPGKYQGIEVWVSPGKTTLSVAQWSDQLLLVGLRKTLEAAIDRSLLEVDHAGAARQYSPLLARAAHFAQEDLWVVANQLPDPVASVFVPLDVEARSFQGAISVRDGLRVNAELLAASEKDAAAIAETIRQSIPALPSVARGLQVTVSADTVSLGMEMSPDQLAASLRRTEAQPSVVTPAAEKPPEPTGPQIIRILGLDDGPREIVLPPLR
jgi:hypothetical protein